MSVSKTVTWARLPGASPKVRSPSVTWPNMPEADATATGCPPVARTVTVGRPRSAHARRPRFAIRSQYTEVTELTPSPPARKNRIVGPSQKRAPRGIGGTTARGGGPIVEGGSGRQATTRSCAPHPTATSAKRIGTRRRRTHTILA